MPLKNTQARWGSVSQALHWLVVLLILAMAWLGLTMGGLPNGPGPSVWLHTSELGGSPAIAGGPNTLITHWTGVEPTFSDLWSTHMTWAGVGESHYFRCMWSNELR